MQLVTTIKVNPRAKMQKDGLETAKQFEKEAVERLRRMSIAAAQLQVRRRGRAGADRAAPDVDLRSDN